MCTIFLAKLYLGVSAECSQTHFTSRDSPDRVNYDGHKWFLEVLV